jgi:hypothetical protein
MTTPYQKITLENVLINLGLEVFRTVEKNGISVYCNKSLLSETCTLNDIICNMYHVMEIRKLSLQGEFLIGYLNNSAYLVYRCNTKKEMLSDITTLLKLCD